MVTHEQGGAYRSQGDVTGEPAPTILGGHDQGDRNAAHLQVAMVSHLTGGDQGQGDVTNPGGLYKVDGYDGGKAADVTAGPAPAIAVGLSVESYHWQVHGGAGSLGPGCTDPETGANLAIGEHTKIWQAWKAAFGHRLPDGATCRKLTLGELRRLGGFPDDYHLTGSYAERWERVGQSVPPPMAYHVAKALADRVLLPARKTAGG